MWAAGATAILPLLDRLGMTSSTRARDGVSAKDAGFRMPLESDRHERTFMQWPARASIYGSNRALDAVRSGRQALLNVITPY